MNLTVFAWSLAPLLLFVYPAFPQATGRLAVGNARNSTANGGKDDRFPDGRVHDFGRVARGTYCKHAFRIVNTTDAPIEITNVRTPPGAVRARVGKTRLRPCEEGQVAVRVETARFVGPKAMTVYLFMRKGKGPVEEYRFSVMCHSDAGLKLDPRVVLQNRLMEAACKGVRVDRDGFPPSPGVYLGNDRSPDIVTVLEEGADVNKPDQRGCTALMYAAICGLVENVKTLLAHGADATSKDEEGWTVLMFAEANHHFRIEGRREVARVLKEHLAKRR